MTDGVHSKALKVQLDPAKLLLLGGAPNLHSTNSRMIGVKWSPTCKD